MSAEDMAPQPAGAPAEADSTPATPGTSRDPSARIQALTADLRAADAVINELKGRDLAGQVEQLQAQLATHAEATASWEQQQAAWQKERAGWEDQRAMLTVGIVDPEGQAVAQALYGIQPEADRGSLADWLGQHSNGSTPAALMPYLRSSAPQAAVSSAPEASPGAAPAQLPPPPGKPTQAAVEATPAQLADLERRMWAAKGRQFESLRDQLAKLTGRGV